MVSHRWREWLANLGLAGASLLICAMVFEFVVFRYIFVPDDVLPNVTVDGVVRYKPGTHAVFRHPGGRTSRVTINAQGWNSVHASYDQAKPRCRTRIAVIGDSYVHAAYVDPEKSFAARLEQRLNSAGRDAQVYRFGMDGAPLSQYLHVLRRHVLAYKPDVVVVPLIHNDFDESYRFLKTRYASSFMKLRQRADGTVEEVPPADFRSGVADRLRDWNTFRYLYYETGLYLTGKSWISRYFWGGNEDWRPEFISSGVDIRKVNDHPRNRFFARYVLAEMQKLAALHGFRLIVVMDGVREAIYEGRQPLDYEVGRLNRIAAEVTAELGITFRDLQTVFQADYDRYRQRFEFPYDWHWNERANDLVAATLADLIEGNATRERRTTSAVAPRLPTRVLAR